MYRDANRAYANTGHNITITRKIEVELLPGLEHPQNILTL